MTLNNLKPHPKRNKTSKRIGRGNGSGKGTYSTKGMKGQTSRTGGKRRPGFEGGQMPLIRRIPKLGGFKNPNRIEYQVVNLQDLNAFDQGQLINAEFLASKGLVNSKRKPVKILGYGNLEKSLKFQVAKISHSALEKIKSSGSEILEQ